MSIVNQVQHWLSTANAIPMGASLSEGVPEPVLRGGPTVPGCARRKYSLDTIR
jgi:hypothetical protein